VERAPRIAEEIAVIVTMLSWFALGVVAGGVARALMPGRYGLGATTALGAIGSVAGGALGNLLTEHGLLAPHPAGFLGSFFGALLALIVIRAAASRETGRSR
jgi:uncharacterized membrane protein YeaQ/YmgE (transglycosylase-associated protein family)